MSIQTEGYRKPEESYGKMEVHGIMEMAVTLHCLNLVTSKNAITYQVLLL